MGFLKGLIGFVWVLSGLYTVCIGFVEFRALAVVPVHVWQGPFHPRPYTPVALNPKP